MQINIWTKIAKNGHCDADRSKGNPKNMTLTIEGENPLKFKFDMHQQKEESLNNTICETM